MYDVAGIDLFNSKMCVKGEEYVTCKITCDGEENKYDFTFMRKGSTHERELFNTLG